MDTIIGGYDVTTIRDVLSPTGGGLHRVNVPSHVDIRIDYVGNHLTGFIISDFDLSRAIFKSSTPVCSMVTDSMWSYFFTHITTSEVISRLKQYFIAHVVENSDGEYLYSALKPDRWLELPDKFLNSDVYYLPKSYAKLICDNLSREYGSLNESAISFINEYKTNLILNNNIPMWSNNEYAITNDDAIIEFPDYRVKKARYNANFTLLDPIVSSEWMLYAYQYSQHLELGQCINNDPVFEFTACRTGLRQSLLDLTVPIDGHEEFNSIFKILSIIAILSNATPYG